MGGRDARFIARWLDELDRRAADWVDPSARGSGGNSLVQFASSRHELLPPVSLSPAGRNPLGLGRNRTAGCLVSNLTLQLPARDPLRAFGQATCRIEPPHSRQRGPSWGDDLSAPFPTFPFTAGQ